jgi:hypothetical protein
MGLDRRQSLQEREFCLVAMVGQGSVVARATSTRSRHTPHPCVTIYKVLAPSFEEIAGRILQLRVQVSALWTAGPSIVAVMEISAETWKVVALGQSRITVLERVRWNRLP